jgi:hypothetical protein
MSITTSVFCHTEYVYDKTGCREMIKMTLEV